MSYTLQFKNLLAFTVGVIIILFFTSVTLLPFKVVLTDTVARVVARLRPITSPSPVAVAGDALGKVVISRRAVIALSATVVELAVTLAVHSTAGGASATFKTAVALAALGVIVVTLSTLVAANARVTRLAEAHTTACVTNLIGGAHRVALTS